ncbi:hypothetical protein BJ165DRAFT_1501580 [Panaeolus papilionaceus]|nr:hypothetical protein BJ165DRAFT_1501580 [Panaeolus papilionaceus]
MKNRVRLYLVDEAEVTPPIQPFDCLSIPFVPAPTINFLSPNPFVPIFIPHLRHHPSST